MLSLVSSTKGIIIMSILGVLVLIPILYWIHKPEYIEVENGRPKIKEKDLFYNLPLQNPMFVKLAILIFVFTLISSVIMFYYGVEFETFKSFFKLFVSICYLLLGLQILEERKTIFFGFSPIIIKVTRFLKDLSLIVLGILFGIFYLTKNILLIIVNVFFILPFKILYKLLGIK